MVGPVPVPQTLLILLTFHAGAQNSLGRHQGRAGTREELGIGAQYLTNNILLGDPHEEI